MIFVLCTGCQLAVRIMGDSDEVDALVGQSSDFWPDKFPCPECEKLVSGYLELQVDHRVTAITRVVDLSAQEAFAAFHGLGLPAEMDGTLETLTHLLSKNTVKKVVGKNILGTTRSIITRLELSDGSKIYLGAGAAGACVYRVVRSHSYVESLDAS